MALLVALVAAGIILVRWTPVGDYLTKEQVIAFLDRLKESPWSPFLLAAGYAVTGIMMMPVSPLVLAGGVVFGPLLGSIYNILGLVFSAMVVYWVGLALGRDFMTHLGGPRLRRAERVFHRRGFWPLVQTRFLPIPFTLISYGAALAGVPAMRFLLTSTIGLIPATVMHTYFSSMLYQLTFGEESAAAEAAAATSTFHPAAVTLVAYIATWATLALVTGWPTIREGLRRRRRYRELMERRRAVKD